MALNTASNLASPDDFYEALIDAHRELSNQQSHALNARLVLLLANHIGHLDVLKAALQAARESGDSRAPTAAATSAAASAAGSAPAPTSTSTPTPPPASPKASA